MINLDIKTKLSASEVYRLLKSFFCGELGLKITEETESCLSFEGGGGYVFTNVYSEEEETKVNLKSSEWERQVKEFARRIPKR